MPLQNFVLLCFVFFIGNNIIKLRLSGGFLVGVKRRGLGIFTGHHSGDCWHAVRRFRPRQKILNSLVPYRVKIAVFFCMEFLFLQSWLYLYLVVRAIVKAVVVKYGGNINRASVSLLDFQDVFSMNIMLEVGCMSF